VNEGRVTQIWAAAIIDELARSGVRTVVVAPGSRSTPLVLAITRDQRLQSVVQVDERSAGFFALGVGKATGMPAAVVTTSGTAAANLYPAVVEAAWSEVPLLVVTADRPHRLRGGDANQAIDQNRLFGMYAKRFFEVAPASSAEADLRHVRQLTSRAVAAAWEGPAGPVHMNVPFEKPLQPDATEPWPQPDAFGRPDGQPYTQVSSGTRTPDQRALECVVGLVQEAKRGWLVAGAAEQAGPSDGRDDLGSELRSLAEETGFILLADPLSGARHKAYTHLDHYDVLLGDDEVARALAPDLILRIGRSPTSQSLNDRIAHASATGVPVVLIDSGGRWKDHTASVSLVVRADVGTLRAHLSREERHPEGGFGAARSRCAVAANEALLAEPDDEHFEGRIARRVATAVPGRGNLFVSSSMPIRDIDAFVGSYELERVRVFGNRGASGIDGIVSTALGVAHGSATPTVCLLGDLAFLHDLNGFLATDARQADVVFVVVNNDGGGIFHMLPVRDHEPAFTRFFATPHGRDFRHAAALHDLPYRLSTAQTIGEDVRAAAEAGGVHILELRTDRERNTSARRRVIESMRAAARRALHSIDSSNPEP